MYVAKQGSTHTDTLIMTFILFSIILAVAFICNVIGLVWLYQFTEEQSLSNASFRHRFDRSEIVDDDIKVRVEKLSDRVYALEKWSAGIDRKLKGK
jgi:uncharacterized membrane protein